MKSGYKWIVQVDGKEPACNAEDLAWEGLLEKEKADWLVFCEYGFSVSAL